MRVLAGLLAVITLTTHRSANFQSDSCNENMIPFPSVASSSDALAEPCLERPSRAPSHYGSISSPPDAPHAHREQIENPSADAERKRTVGLHVPATQLQPPYNRDPVRRAACLALGATLGASLLVLLLSSSPHGGTGGELKSSRGGTDPALPTASSSSYILGGSWWGLEGVLTDTAGSAGSDPGSAESGGFSETDDYSEPSSSSSDYDDESASLLGGPLCEYVAIQGSRKGKNGPGWRKVMGIQTSKKEPGKQWSEFACRERSGEDADDLIVAGNDAATIIIDFPLTSSGDDDDSTNKERDSSADAFQTILGFGGSITEATTLNWKSLTSVARDAVLELLYGDTGLGYRLGRVPVGSCDFSVSQYNFADNEDLSLESFDRSVKRDYENGMIDMIKSATYVAEQSWEEGVGLDLVASPWSPPSWMKQPLPTDPFDASHAGTMERTVLPECLRDGAGPGSRYASAWARYIGEFISAYQQRGIDFWAVTVQNEPLGVPKFEACAHDKSSEKEFVVHHLGPVLRESHPNVKIFAYDTNKDQCVDFMAHFWNPNDSTSSTTSEDLSLQYIDGAALHWYSRSHSALDGGEGAPNMHRLKELALTQRRLVTENDATSNASGERQRNRLLGRVANDASNKTKKQRKWIEPILLDTEATHCSSTGYAENDIDLSWHRAERSAHAILSQLAAGSNGFIEWNMVLDPFGGPNHAENFCDAPLIAVPHRAEGLTDFVQPVPSFEKHQLQDGESIKGEYETKFSLSKKMGYSMSLMNLGIVAQPMYYYVGHISRYVRPGSRPVRAIVSEGAGGISSRTFRPTGHVGPGGGYNDLAREGTEVTFWPCEGSTRQSWSFSKGGEIHMTQYNHRKSTLECFSLSEVADVNLGGILLTRCGASDVGLFDMIPVETSGGIEAGTEAAPSGGLTKFSAMKNPGSCLGIRGLANNGGAYGPRGGSQASLVSCDDPSALWSFSPETGEISSAVFPEGEVCMTTGWPFLQAGVFDTSRVGKEKLTSHRRSGGLTLVVLNESKDDASFVVKSSNNIGTGPLLKSSIQAHSIQTFVIK